MASAGSIVVDLLARTGSFETDMDRAAKSAKKRADEIDKALSAIGTAAATAGAAAAGALALLVNQTMNSAREIERQAQISNASADAFQTMAYGARTVGIEQDKLADILKDVNDRVGDFISTGGGPMKDFFEQIAPKVGVTADQFARLSGPEALQLYVSSLEKAGASQQEMTFYLEAMASDTTALIPLLAEGGREMAALGEEARRTGQIMSDETIAAASELKGQMDQLSGQLTGAKNIIAGELIPVLSVAATEMISFGGSGDLARFSADKLRVVLQELVIGAAEVTAWFQKSGMTLGAWAAQAGAIFSGDFAGAKFIGQELDNDLADIEARLNVFRGRVSAAGSDLAGALGAGSIMPAAPSIGGGSGARTPTGRTSAPRASSRASSGMTEEQKEYNRLMQEGARIYEQTRTASEKLAIEFERLNELRDAGAISQDTYNRAVFAAQDAYDANLESTKQLAADQERLNQLLAATPTAQLDAQRQTMLFLAEAFEAGRISAQQFEEAAITSLGNVGDKAEETGDVMTEFARSAAEGMQRAMADFLFDPFADGLDGMLQGFGQMIQRMIAEAVAADLANRLFGDLLTGGSGSNGWIGAGLDALFSANGNAFAGSGPVQAFASGGAFGAGEILTRPTLFRFADGGAFRTGVAGEAGPEAALPLARMANGKLGVLTSGERGQTINLTVNVASGTPSEVRRAAGAGAREALAAFSKSQRYA